MALSHSQLDCIAKWAVSGLHPKDIANGVGCTPQTVVKLLKGGSNEQFDALYQGWQQKSIQSLGDHRFKLQGALPIAYEVNLKVMTQDKDLRLAWEAAKWLLENPALTGHQPAAPPGLSLTLGVQTNIVGEQVALAVGDIGSQLASLALSISQQRSERPDPHEKVGDDALPASYRLINDDSAGPGAKPPTNGSSAPPELEGTPVEPTEPPGD